MTRINIIEPHELTDQHLVAEYREIFMVGSSLQRSLKSPNWDVSKIPAEYTLNKGHVTFFYDKGKYLEKRYKALIDEMKKRGMKPDESRVFKYEQWPAHLYNDWQPAEKDRNVARARIYKRISEKPGWYRYYGEYYLYGHFVDMGYAAYDRGIKYADQDPAFTLAMLAEVGDRTLIHDPEDDWNQGWLKAHYEKKEDNK